MTLDSDNIKFMRIFAGVPWKGGVIQQWGSRKPAISLKRGGKIGPRLLLMTTEVAYALSIDTKINGLG